LPFGRIENGIPETSEPVSGIFVLREEPLINGLKIATTSKIVIPRSASERESRLFPGNIGSPIKAFGDDEKLPQKSKAMEKLFGQGLSDKLPLVVLCDQDGLVYLFSSGYKIGLGEQLLKLTR